MSEHLTKEQVAVHITAVLLPTPDLIKAGAPITRDAKVTTVAKIADELANYVRIAAESNVFALGGTVTFMIQPIKKDTVQ